MLRCARLALEKKANDVRALDVRERSSFTDFFLLCSGSSDRQVAAVARHIEDTLRKDGVRALGVEGLREGRWVLLDYGDFVVHVFLEETRRFYDLERLWSDAPRVAWEEPVPAAIAAGE